MKIRLRGPSKGPRGYCVLNRPYYVQIAHENCYQLRAECFSTPLIPASWARHYSQTHRPKSLSISSACSWRSNYLRSLITGEYNLPGVFRHFILSPQMLGDSVHSSLSCKSQESYWNTLMPWLEFETGTSSGSVTPRHMWGGREEWLHKHAGARQPVLDLWPVLARYQTDSAVSTES